MRPLRDANVDADVVLLPSAWFMTFNIYPLFGGCLLSQLCMCVCRVYVCVYVHVCAYLSACLPRVCVCVWEFVRGRGLQFAEISENLIKIGSHFVHFANLFCLSLSLPLAIARSLNKPPTHTHLHTLSQSCCYCSVWPWKMPTRNLRKSMKATTANKSVTTTAAATTTSRIIIIIVKAAKKKYF